MHPGIPAVPLTQPPPDPSCDADVLPGAQRAAQTQGTRHQDREADGEDRQGPDRDEHDAGEEKHGTPMVGASREP